jgi:small conductance mechanosensitive channel
VDYQSIFLRGRFNDGVERGFDTLVVVVCCALVIAILRLLVRRAMRRSRGGRADTLIPLLNSALTYTVVLAALFTVLMNIFGVDMTALLAAAGVLGVAVGFGAQTLVKDIIAGFFLLLDGQLLVGDHVTVEGYTGTVEALGLRLTTLRGEEGDILYVPNGSIGKVLNHSRPPKP